MKQLSSLLTAVKRSIEIRGGGVRGSAALAYRAWRMLRTLGFRGLLARLRAAGRVMPTAQAPDSDYSFPPPVAIEGTTLRVGVMLHLFYADLAEEFAAALSHMPVPFTLLVSVSDVNVAARIRSVFADLDRVERLEIACVPNRGRDIAPMLVTFRDALLELDIVGHLHSKKSLYTGSVQNRWRTYLLDSLLGSRKRIAWQLGMFAADRSLGIVYPESHETVPLWGHTWLGNVAEARTLADRLGFAIDPHAYIDFPAGSMFWARIDALRPLLELGLTSDAFPLEEGQLDGTLQHALERLFVAVVRARGYRAGILPGDGTLALTTEGARNWQSYFKSSLEEKIGVAAVDARLVSLDVFDTLVQRPFLSADATRVYLDRLMARTLGLARFMDLRSRAEARARHAAQRDATLAEIYVAMSELAPGLPTDAMRLLELVTERRLLQPRTAVLEALQPLRARGLRLVALSDMYLDATSLKSVLPRSAVAVTDDWYVSSEQSWRKDDGSAWAGLASIEHVPMKAWLHIGDNEHADVQQPHWQRMLTPVHVLRASALLDVVPALRPLRVPASAPWPEQLRLGLIANHFGTVADTAPDAFEATLRVGPETFGYVVIGPLVLDYLIWLTHVARSRHASRLLFLSREGHLLAQAYERLASAAPSLAQGVDGTYFLASRQASGFAALREADDLAGLLGGAYNGTLGHLIDARLGRQASAVVRSQVGEAAMWEPVFLPEMLDTVLARLEPTLEGLRTLAASARAAYQDYWHEMVGDKQPLIADIGYAGTIQRHLSRMAGRPLGGAYFALDARADETLRGIGEAQARYYDARVGSGPATVLSHDLLLESVLTAPGPQFAGFEVVDGVRQPTFAEGSIGPARWAVVAAVQSAALAYVDAALAAAGPLADELAFDASALQIPLESVGTGRWHAPWLAALGVEDTFTGRGDVPIATRTGT